MFKFLKKIFGYPEPYRDTAEILAERQALDEQICIASMPTPKIVEIPFITKSLDELLWSLRSYDGYTRQRTLEHLKDCYDQTLFPALLFRLSDYVEINRNLAAQHIQRWSQHPEFSQLCLSYFLEIAAVQQRVRTVPDIENLLLNEVAKNQEYLQRILISEQGQLPRVLLAYIKRYQWIESQQLLELCKNAKDQLVRKFWLAHIIKNESEQTLVFELKHSKFREVKYHLFDVLYQRQILNSEDVIELWHSRFLSVMDYAYFVLRQQKFDFQEYFNQHPIELLNSQQAKIRAYQWILFKGDQAQFFKIISKIETQQITNALVLYAVKQKFIQFDQYLSYLQSTQQKLLPYQFFKAKIYSGTQPTLDDLVQYIQLLKENISLEQRLSLTQNYDLWDQVYWFVTQEPYIQSEREQQNFDYEVKCRLQFLHYETYPPRWTVGQKGEMKQHLPLFVQKYPEIFEEMGVKKVLEKYLS
ncbi:hypothetical protein EAH57_02525 [Acinetobacter sp. 2JN-4]|nr:hypothetical protein EAH57_02525 [Acinetobacter sp. 2JN-4]